MKITEAGSISKKQTTLNDIPVGQVFRGTIVGRTGASRFTGTFLKAQGRDYVSAISSFADERHVSTDVVVVSLGGPITYWATPKGGHVAQKYETSLFIWCRTVEDYEPLESELIVKPVKG